MFACFVSIEKLADLSQYLLLGYGLLKSESGSIIVINYLLIGITTFYLP